MDTGNRTVLANHILITLLSGKDQISGVELLWRQVAKLRQLESDLDEYVDFLRDSNSARLITEREVQRLREAEAKSKELKVSIKIKEK